MFQEDHPNYDLDAMTIEEKLGQMIVARYVDWAEMEEFAAKGWMTGLTPQLTGKPLAEAADWINHIQSVSKYPLLLGWCSISFSVATIEEDLGLAHTPANEFLNDCVRQRLPNADAAPIGMEPSGEEIQASLAAASDADLVIFGLFTRVRSYAEDGIRLHPAYRDLIGRVVATGRPTVYLNFGNPWMTADLPKPHISICTYSDATGSIEAALQIAFGEIRAQGKLPVALSGEYPFGYGL